MVVYKEPKTKKNSKLSKTSKTISQKKPSTSKRSKVKYPALLPQYNLTRRKEYNDYDYIKKLSPKEKEFLNKFTEEYHNARFVKNKPTKTNLHKKKKDRRLLYRENNARNRDTLTLKKITAHLDYFEDIEGEEPCIESSDIKQIEIMDFFEKMGINPHKYYQKNNGRWYKEEKDEKGILREIWVEDLQMEFKDKINNTSNNKKT